MRYRPPRNKWGADFAEDYEKNLEDIERDITSVQEQFNQVVIEGDSSVEAAQARVDAKNVAQPTLKARLDKDYNEVTAQLADKANKDEVRLKSVKNELEDMSPTVLAAIEGGEGTSFNLLSIPQDRSVTPEKTDFVVTGKNLIDETKIIVGENINETTGGAPTSSTSVRTDYVKINPTDALVFTSFGSDSLSPLVSNIKGAYYDANKTFISGIASIGSVGGAFDASGTRFILNIPSNAQYIRISISSLTRLMQLEKGTTGTNYEKFNLKFKNALDIDVKNILKKNSVDFDMTNFVAVGKNIIDESLVVLGQDINTSTGGAPTQSSSKRTDYVEIKPTDTLIFTSFGADSLTPIVSNIKGAYYDANKTFISGLASIGNVGGTMGADGRFTLSIPTNAKYVRISISSLTRLMQLEKNIGTSYEPYNLQFKRKQTVVTDVKPLYKYGRFSQDEMENWYSSLNESHSIFTPSTTIEEFHTAFNNLLSNYPEYATITNLGLDSSGQHNIYRYDLVPEKAVGSEYTATIPKIVIINGQHGHEKVSVFSLYYLVKDMLENWESNSILEYLRFNIRFVIIPSANPSGFAANSRFNNNNVDLNRNYDYQWSIDPSPNKGTAPFSEPETKYIKAILESDKDMVYFVDFHTNNSSGTDYVHSNGIVLVGGSYFNTDLGEAGFYHIKKITRVFSKEYDPNNNGEFFGYISQTTTNATLKNYVATLGIPSTTFEGCQKFPTENVFMSENTLKANTELVGNWLAAVIKQFRKESKTFDLTKG